MTTADWRGVIQKNQRRSTCVIFTFVLIYICLGLIIDLFLYQSQINLAASVSLSEVFVAMLTLRIMPYATILCLLVALVSLMITFVLHDKIMLLGTDAVEVNQYSKQPDEQQLFHCLEELKIAAGMRYLPKLYIIEADYMNAFASGYSESSSMIVITRGLLNQLTRDELQAVLAHELTHVRHLDIKLTLIASVLSNLTLIVIDTLFYSLLFGRRRRDSDSSQGVLVLMVIVLRFLLPLITVLLTLYLSRSREYMADAGAVELMRNNEPLGRALIKISRQHLSQSSETGALYAQIPHESVRRSAYIFDPQSAGIQPSVGLGEWLSTHPSLRNRLAAIGFNLD